MANLAGKHRTVPLGQATPPADCQETELYHHPSQTGTQTDTRTHGRANQNPEAGFPSGTIFKKEKPFVKKQKQKQILLHEPTNFWHSYIFKHLALIFVQKRVNNTKTCYYDFTFRLLIVY